MAVITISATGIGHEYISGIPQFVVLETNIPATLFFTLDGTLPTVLSDVYTEAIEMPVSGTTQLRVLAISGSDQGELDLTFSTDTTDLRFPRRSEAILGAGVVVDAYATPDVLTDGYGIDSAGLTTVPIRSSDVELTDLDIKFSRTGAGGEGSGTLIAIGFPAEELERASSINHDASSPNNNNIFFDPRSLYITIDGRDGYQDQIHDGYQIINRPWEGTMDVLKYMRGKLMFEPQPYVSGGHVRTLYNSKTGTAVAYYFDHNETRWIKSIQSYDPSQAPRNVGLRATTGGPLVFKWVYNKRSAI